MAETGSQGAIEEGSRSSPHINRRQLLKAAAVGGIAVLAGSIPTRFYGMFDTRRDEGAVEKDVENRFGVEVLSTNEAYDAFGKPFSKKLDKDLIFDNAQLKMLAEFFPLLPPHFYGSHNGKKLNVADVKKEFIPGMQRGSFSKPSGFPSFDDRPVLMLVGDFFQPVRKGTAFRVISHELVHRVDYELTDDHVLWKEVEEILGYDTFSDFRDSALSILNEITPESEEARSIRDWLGYGLKGMDGKGKDVPDEFLGVLGGTYVGGRKDFDQISTWLGKETTDRLYAFMRDRVFDGKEYNGDQRPAFLDESSYRD